MAVSGLLTLTVPLLLAGVGLCGVLTGTDVFSALTDGARDGLRTVARIFPALAALLTAVSMLRASGALVAVYFGACGIRRSRWAVPAAITADVTGFITAAALVRCIWGP